MKCESHDSARGDRHAVNKNPGFCNGRWGIRKILHLTGVFAVHTISGFLICFL